MSELEKWRLLIMKALIKDIKVTERIRKEINKIDELAADIRINGLINPITVMTTENEKYRLIAGLRRLRAIESIGLFEIDINIVSPATAEAILMLEVSENEQREQFTFTEKMSYAELFKEIENSKAEKRKTDGQLLGGITAGKGRPLSDSLRDTCPASYESNNETAYRVRDAIGNKIGMSGRQYDRAKFVDENVSDEVREEIDKGQRTIGEAYKELRSKDKAKKNFADFVKSDAPKKSESEETSKIETEPETINSDCELKKEEIKTDEKNVKTCNPATESKYSIPPNMAGLFSKEDEEAIRRNNEFNAMSPSEKVKELQRQLREERARAARSESELSRLKELHHNAVYHKDGIIANLSERLEKAEARIEELENLNCPK